MSALETCCVSIDIAIDITSQYIDMLVIAIDIADMWVSTYTTHNVNMWVRTFT